MLSLECGEYSPVSPRPELWLPEAPAAPLLLHLQRVKAAGEPLNDGAAPNSVVTNTLPTAVFSPLQLLPGNFLPTPRPTSVHSPLLAALWY